jgi:hypothetical protein
VEAFFFTRPGTQPRAPRSRLGKTFFLRAVKLFGVLVDPSVVNFLLLLFSCPYILETIVVASNATSSFHLEKQNWPGQLFAPLA